MTTVKPLNSNLATVIHGVGPIVLTRLRSLGIHTLTDLLQHYPTRYDDFSRVVSIAQAPLDESITLRVTVEKIASKKGWQRKRFSLVNATVTDDTGQLKVVWFNQNYITEQLAIGTSVMLSGKIKQTKYGKQLVNPSFEKVKTELVHTGRLVPHYPTTYRLTQKQLRYFIKQALQLSLPEWLPTSILAPAELCSYQEALQSIHFPTTVEDVVIAKRRLAFDELLVMQLVSLRLREETAADQAPSITVSTELLQAFTQRLPFTLTAGQKKAAWEIIQDLQQVKPMNRLLEGDVGAGKTVVAAMALYATAKAGYQGVLMAPTEILAQQHFQKLVQLLSPLHIPVGLVTAHHKEYPTARIIVGTQALLNGSMQFPKLALTVIDEQHRFGVAQRQALKEKNTEQLTPHLLSMTATPIPRSLALTAYGDLALSIIDELPSNRLPIQTRLITDTSRSKMYQLLQQRVTAGEQAYVVAPRIEDDEETSDKASVESEQRRLAEQLPQLRMAVLHGQLSKQAKQAVMTEFRQGMIDVLITTTVIEVGVDVPNATVMVIENAECFGLAQLHQLRGRVGRSDKASYCFACTTSDSTAVLERLAFFAKTRSGFTLAEYDLERRGPGAVYGQEQSGFLNSFKIAKLSDHQLISVAQQAAKTLLPVVNNYPALTERLNDTLNQIHLE